MVVSLVKLVLRAGKVLRNTKGPSQIRRKVENHLDTIKTYKKYKAKPSTNTIRRFNNVISRAENNPHLWPKGKQPKNPLKHKSTVEKD